MEPVTHFLTGACIGRAGLNRKTAYATLAAVLAAEAADLDILWGFAGPVEALKHHRGITHTFWAVPIIAGVIVGVVWLIDRIRHARKQHKLNRSSLNSTPIKGAPSFSSAPAGEKGGTAHTSSSAPSASEGAYNQTPQSQPIHWGWLYLTAFIAALTHLLLDWTNNYGLRPFFPFNPRWYAGSFMFIAEPVLWALFFFALFMPWVLGLADREIGARRKRFRGRGWAIFALVGMVTLGCWRWAERAQAGVMLDNTQVASAPVTRFALEPYPINPFRWHAILETADFYQTAEIDTRTQSILSDPRHDVMYKPIDTPAVEAAKRTLLGQVYLDWGTWAVVRDIGPVPVPGIDPPRLPPGRTWTTIEFTDLRFDYDFVPTRGHDRRAPLGGAVYIVDGQEEAGEAMNGQQQR
jgi:inner membrane protein